MLRDEDRRVHAALLHDPHHAFEVLASAPAQGELQGFPGHATTDGKLRDLDAVDVVVQLHGVCFPEHVARHSERRLRRCAADRAEQSNWSLRTSGRAERAGRLCACCRCRGGRAVDVYVVCCLRLCTCSLCFCFDSCGGAGEVGFGAVHGFEGFQLAALGVEVGTVVHDVRDDAGAVLHHVDGLRKGEVITTADEDLIRALRLCLREDVVHDGRAGGVRERMHTLRERTMQAAIVQHFDVTACLRRGLVMTVARHCSCAVWRHGVHMLLSSSFYCYRSVVDVTARRNARDAVRRHHWTAVTHRFRDADVLRAGTDGVDRAGTGELRAEDGGEADGPDAHHDDGVAWLDAGFFDRGEAGLEDVDAHERVLEREAVRDVCEVSVRVRKIEQLLEGTVNGVPEHVGAEIMARMCIVLLDVRLAPVRGDRGYGDDIADIKIRYLCADFLDTGDDFMAERQVRALRAALPDGMDVRGAWRDKQRLQQCAMRVRQRRPLLLDVCDISFSFQHKRFHGSRSFSSIPFILCYFAPAALIFCAILFDPVRAEHEDADIFVEAFADDAGNFVGVAWGDDEDLIDRVGDGVVRGHDRDVGGRRESSLLERGGVDDVLYSSTEFRGGGEGEALVARTPDRHGPTTLREVVDVCIDRGRETVVAVTQGGHIDEAAAVVELAELVRVGLPHDGLDRVTVHEVHAEELEAAVL